MRPRDISRLPPRRQHRDQQGCKKVGLLTSLALRTIHGLERLEDLSPRRPMRCRALRIFDGSLPSPYLATYKASYSRPAKNIAGTGHAQPRLYDVIRCACRIPVRYHLLRFISFVKRKWLSRSTQTFFHVISDFLAPTNLQLFFLHLYPLLLLKSPP